MFRRFFLNCHVGIGTTKNLFQQQNLSCQLLRILRIPDTATPGCAYAHALQSDAEDISDQDDDSLFEASHSIELKSDGGGGNLLCNPNLHCQKHPIIFFDYLLN